MLFFSLTFQFVKLQCRGRRRTLPPPPPPPPPHAQFYITVPLRLLPPLQKVLFSFCSCLFFFVKIEHASPRRLLHRRRRFFRLRVGPSPLRIRFYSGSSLYDFNGQDVFVLFCLFGTVRSPKPRHLLLRFGTVGKPSIRAGHMAVVTQHPPMHQSEKTCFGFSSYLLTYNLASG